LKKGVKYDAYKFRILDLLKEKGPLHPYELEGQLNDIPHASLMDCLSKLEAKGWVKPLEDGRRALWVYEELEEPIRHAVEGWIQEFRDLCFVRPLALEELMYRVGEDYEDSEDRSRVRRLALKHGWIPPEISLRLVEHSRRDLKPAAETWLRHLRPTEGVVITSEPLENLYGLGSLDVYDAEIHIRPPRDPDTANFNFLKQHLETGCPEMLNEWRRLCVDANEFLSLAESLARKILERLMEKAGELGVPCSNMSGEPRVFPHNCVSLIYRELKGETRLDLHKDIKVEKERSGDKILYVVKPGPLMVVDEERKAEGFADFIRREIPRQENKEEIGRISKERRKLEDEIEAFKASLERLVSGIEEGCYVKGWCEKCKHLQKHEASC